MTGGRAIPVGAQLRLWRERRRLSQLELSIQAEISTRHLSFVETGRSRPSREMVLHLAERLEVPLRERNQLLLAAGYAPAYPERGLDSTALRPVAAAVRQILAGHEPYPAVLVNPYWEIVDMNASVTLFTEAVPPELLAPPANVLRIALHPDGLASRIIDLPVWRGHLLDRLRRQAEQSGDPKVAALYEELRGFPGGESHDGPDPAQAIAIPLRYRYRDTELTFVSAILTFGAPLDVTISELAIEAFFPADDHTAAVLHARA
jgi:transcriptional regulator with XRE-family HTH domain